MCVAEGCNRKPSPALISTAAVIDRRYRLKGKATGNYGYCAPVGEKPVACPVSTSAALTTSG